MVPHKVNNTPPPWIHSAAANHTTDERCETRLCWVPCTWTNCLHHHKHTWATSSCRLSSADSYHIVFSQSPMCTSGMMCTSGWATALSDVDVTVIDLWITALHWKIHTTLVWFPVTSCYSHSDERVPILWRSRVETEEVCNFAALLQKRTISPSFQTSTEACVSAMKPSVWIMACFLLLGSVEWWWLMVVM